MPAETVKGGCVICAASQLEPCSMVLGGYPRCTSSGSFTRGCLGKLAVAIGVMGVKASLLLIGWVFCLALTVMIGYFNFKAYGTMLYIWLNGTVEDKLCKCGCLRLLMAY